MENASKALIIAGAILLAISIIGVGMFVFNRANSTVQQTTDQMTSLEISTFNSQFEQYSGKARGSEVKTLLSRVEASNGSYDGSTGASARSVAVHKGPSGTTGSVSNTSTVLALLKPSQEYTVYLHYTKGIVDQVIVIGTGL